MRFITNIVRRASRKTTEQPKTRTHGRSPRARLREEAFSMLS